MSLLAAEVVAEQAANGGDARGATDEYNLVDLIIIIIMIMIIIIIII